METIKKYKFISPSLFGIVVICFFMSFFTVQCSSSKVMTLNGTDLVFGKEINMKNPMTGINEVQKLSPNIWAIIPFVLSLIGAGLYFVNVNYKSLIILIISVIGVISLFALKNNLNNQIESQGGGMVSLSISPQIGYYICIFGLIFTGLINLLLYKENKKINAS